MGRYIGQIRLASSEKMLYFYEDGPYQDVLTFLKELTGIQPTYLRSVRAWSLPSNKINKKTFYQRLNEQGWTYEVLE